MKSENPSPNFSLIIQDRLNQFDGELTVKLKSPDVLSHEEALVFMGQILSPFSYVNLYKFEAEYGIDEDEIIPEDPTDIDKALITYPHFAAAYDMNEVIASYQTSFQHEGQLRELKEDDIIWDYVGADDELFEEAFTQASTESNDRYQKMQTLGIPTVLMSQINEYVEKYKVKLLYNLEIYDVKAPIPEEVDEKLGIYEIATFKIMFDYLKLIKPRKKRKIRLKK